MRRVTIATVSILFGLPALLMGSASFATAAQSQSQAAIPSPAPARSGVFIPKSRHLVVPRHGGTTTSLNWSGYAVTATSATPITAVSSTFTVPTAGLVPPGFAATWTGIGGYLTTDLIQAGTAEQSLPALPFLGNQYYAWYEMLPGAEIMLTDCSGDATCAVTPGDTVSVTITQVADTTTQNWKIDMVDAGHWTWSKTVPYQSSRSSAEWILEAPSLGGAQTVLAPVGTVSFGPTSTFSTGGAPIALGSGVPILIDLGLGAVNEATPSSLGANGQSFNDCAYATSCQAPT